MEETLLVTKVEERTTDGGKTYHRIQAGGKWYSCWVFGAAGIKAGETWRVETEQKGSYFNITKLIAQETEPKAVEDAEKVVKVVEGNKEAATNKRTALMQAVALAGLHMAQGKMFNSENVLAVAKSFNEWLNSDVESF